MKNLSQLTEEFQGYCEREKLPQYSADELIHEEISERQRSYISDFIMRWERACELEPPRIVTSGREDHDDDGYGGSYTRYHVCEVPLDWSDEKIAEWVRDHFPAYHCEHAHDCCGHYYPSSATWARADVRSIYRGPDDDHVPLTILVSQGYHQNV